MAHLQVKNIRKTFPGVVALDDISLSVSPGEIHALCGENGAGKSTLMNILTGNLQADKGTILINQKPVTINNPHAAFDNGIAIVYQHLSLATNLSVAENIFANQQPVNQFGVIQYRELYSKTAALLNELHLEDIDPKTLVSKLSPALKQMVEIAKALSRNPDILILDEPTASLTERETRTLFAILQKKKKEGVAIIYISHRMEEIFLLADRITVLKDGRYEGTFLTPEITNNQLIRHMVGRDIQTLKTGSNTQDEVLLEIDKLTGKRFSNVSFKLHRGEILGLAGLVGSGRTEIARAIFGIDTISSGNIRIRDENFRPRHPSDSIAWGLGYVPEDRVSLGLFPAMSIQDNVMAANLKKGVVGNVYRSSKANQLSVEAKNQLGIKATGVQQILSKLSGGNQQKVVLAKWLLTNPDILIVDEPTTGIDVGAKFEIYDVLKSLAAQGKGIIMISSELPELLGLCDRIIVIKKGKVAGEMNRAEATEEKILEMASY